MGVKSFSFLSSSSSETRDSGETISGEATVGKDEYFYEEIEAPKFVDFSSPDHYRPDDRLVLRKRCNLKHEEEMDSEEIYKNFVLRVMAARSPNVRLRKALDRNSSRTPIKCPHSAPPKSSKPRLEIISSLSQKIVDDKKRVCKPHLKPASTTPVTKVRPVAAKYLTTPGNKKCLPNTNSFRSVQGTKTTTIEVSKSRTVVKALVFHSPKKVIKVKTSIELRTPITKLCEGMSKLEISSHRKRALGYSSKSSKKLSRIEEPLCSKTRIKHEKKLSKIEELLCSKTRIKHEKKFVTSSKNNTAIGKLSKPQVSNIVEIDQKDSSITNEGEKDSKQEFIAEDIIDLRLEDAFVSSAEPRVLNDSNLAPPDDLKTNERCLHLEGSDDNNGDRRNKQNDSMKVTSKIGERSTDYQNDEDCTNQQKENNTDQQNENSSYEGDKSKHEFDDKENAATSDGNRMRSTNQKKYEVKKIAQAPDKHLKGGTISSGPVMNFKKPKNTTLKPFRLRTDERGILREAKLERITNHLAPQNEMEKLSSANEKFKVVCLSTPKAQKKLAAASMTTQSQHSLTREQPDLMNSPLGSNLIQRMDKIRKIRSPLQKIVPTKKEIISYLIPGQKLDVIHEISPEVSEFKKAS